MKTLPNTCTALICLAAVISSCTTLDKSSPSEGAYVSPFSPVGLDQFDMNITLMLPDSLAGSADLHWNSSFGRLEVSAGQGIYFYIVEDGLGTKDKKEELKREIFETEIEIDNDQELLYALSLPEGSVYYYNYFAIAEIHGRKYSFENNPLVECSRTDAYQMRDIIQATITFSSTPPDGNIATK